LFRSKVGIYFGEVSDIIQSGGQIYVRLSTLQRGAFLFTIVSDWDEYPNLHVLLLRHDDRYRLVGIEKNTLGPGLDPIPSSQEADIFGTSVKIYKRM
jgi:hypothetical protein